MKWDFEAEVCLWKSDAAWHFLTLPQDVADDMEDMPISRGGFGSLRVQVTIGSSSWGTSIFPGKELGSFLLPLQKPVRETEGLEVGDVCHVYLRIAE